MLAACLLAKVKGAAIRLGVLTSRGARGGAEEDEGGGAGRGGWAGLGSCRAGGDSRGAAGPNREPPSGVHYSSSRTSYFLFFLKQRTSFFRFFVFGVYSMFPEGCFQKILEY
jgi:hypothetical protein